MFFPSSSQQLQDLKIQASSTEREIQTAVPQVTYPALSCLTTSQLYICPLETVSQRAEKIPAVCQKEEEGEEEVVVCIFCPTPGSLEVSADSCASSASYGKQMAFFNGAMD